MSILSVEGVHVYFGGLKALAGVNLSVEEGHIHGLIGPNGSGKTTLCNTISGFYRPNSGKITFHGYDLGSLRPYERIRQGLSRTFQDLQVFGEMTALENVMVGQHYKGRGGLISMLLRTSYFQHEEKETREKALRFLDYVGLKEFERRRANRLSFGQQRLLELARALVSEPSLLILDEPAAGLSLTMVEHLTKILKDLRDHQGTTIVLIEHVIRLVMGISDRITVLDHGERISEGTPDEIRGNTEVITAYLGKTVNHAAN